METTREYSLDYQYSMNITWFFLGADNTIAEFSSGGAIVPSIVARNATENQLLIDYFDSLSPMTEARMNPWLDNYVNPKYILEPSKYGYYANRGLVSFDKINPGPGDSSIDYHLIAHPVEELDFRALPDQIKEILLKNRQPIHFKDFYKIDEGYLLWASLFTDYCVPFSYEPTPKKKNGFWSFFR